MGLIREPKNVDFHVLDKPWTDKERKEVSAFIKLRKSNKKGAHKKLPRQEERKLLLNSTILLCENRLQEFATLAMIR